ncbi:hypothetical protein [Paenibacillus vini]|uniref:Flagellar protein FliT n=1 Tax=Paenibacillus vini TaxID=1476024 RepID=A0ABQ4M6P0_9BACL|nr:hypothetical protein [Paenibacillus vini]GIP51608.1 hypothetical protein J42TS3_06430 [Paenibacillus vini]
MMIVREYISQLEDATLSLVSRINEVDFEELLAFAEQREELVEKILPLKESFADQDRKRLKDLSKYDSMILDRMEHFKSEASQWLLNRGTIKDQRSAYNSSYTPESMFFDRKN